LCSSTIDPRVMPGNAERSVTNMPPAALLAGGLATRLRPLTGRMPKALLQVAGEPFIAHQLRLLRRQDITRVVLCVGHLAEQIKAYVGTGAQFGLQVDYSFEGERLLGTGGALRAARDLLGSEFLVMYGDSWLDTAYVPIVAAFRASHQPGLMTVFRNEGRWDRSNIWFEDGRIRLYDKDARLPQMHYIDWGLGMIQADALGDRPADEPFDLADVYSDLSRAGELAGYEVNTRFYEIGSPEGLAETDSLLRKRAQSL
jgi:NDP-sugar pyrophosphorylase family protein